MLPDRASLIRNWISMFGDLPEESRKQAPPEAEARPFSVLLFPIHSQSSTVTFVRRSPLQVLSDLYLLGEE